MLQTDNRKASALTHNDGAQLESVGVWPKSSIVYLILWQVVVVGSTTGLGAGIATYIAQIFAAAINRMTGLLAG